MRAIRTITMLLLSSGFIAAAGCTTQEVGRVGDAPREQIRYAATARYPIEPAQTSEVRDYDGMRSALLNVTLNALECVPDGGHVDIHLSTDSATASVVISDDGPGIPVALLNSIFDMHFTTKKTGAGIGLYVARAVAESHGGEIRVDSQLGAGSTFTISLPLHRANRRTQA